jgi:phenylacetic acid degradation operon negative regulatory protein
MSSKFTESLANLLIATLSSGRNTKLFHKILCEREFNQYKKESVGVALSRLHKKGLIENSASGWSTTSKGKKYLREVRMLSYIPSTFEKNSPNNLILSFDIPEQDRIIRNWLRNQIKIFGYKMLQQSLWIGPGPLPPVFLKRLDDLKIRKYIKTFKISRKN